MRRAPIGLAALLIVSLTAGGVMAVTYQPDLSVYGTDTTLQTGESGSVGLEIINSADLESQSGNASGTATRVEVSLDGSGTGIDTRGGPVAIGAIPTGSKVPVELPVRVPDDVHPGRYQLTAIVSYEHQTATGATETTTVRRPVSVTVADATPFEIDEISTDVGVGTSGTMTVALDNPVGDIDDVAVTASSTTPKLAIGQGRSQTRYVDEEWDLNHLERVTFDVSVPPGTSVQELPVQFTVEYTTEAGIERMTAPVETTITPAASQSATLSVTEQSLTVGADGSIDATITNDGPKPLHNATIALKPVGSAVTPRASSQPLGTLSTGESASISYPVTVSPRADSGQRQFAFVIQYENDDDAPRKIGPLKSQLSIGNGPEFALSNVTADLRVGADGSIDGTIVNNGSAPARSVVTRLSTSAIGVTPGAASYAVGRLDPGDRAQFSMPISVSSGAEPGPRQVAIDVVYRTADGQQRAGDTHSSVVRIQPAQETFAVAATNATIAAGSSGAVSVDVTNLGEDRLTDLNLKVYADDPLSATSDEAYLDALAPNETKTVSVDIGVASSAPTRSHPIDIDLQYTEPDGDTVLSDTHQVPITVTDEQSSGPSVPAVGIGSMLLLGIGAVAITRFR